MARSGIWFAPFGHIGGNRATPRTTQDDEHHRRHLEHADAGRVPDGHGPDDNDWRGDIQNDDGVFKFMTCDAQQSAPTSSTGPVDTRARHAVTDGRHQFNAARSRHTGGVNVSFCDGSSAS